MVYAMVEMTDRDITNSRLRDFLLGAAANEQESLAHYTSFIDFFERIDFLFQSLTINKFEGNPLSGLLMINAHASLLAAIRIALSGQSPPTFMALRGALESALYALISSQSKENREAWLNRAQNPDHCKKIYTFRHGIRLLENDPNLANVIRDFYELSIEFGAHPNLREVIEHTTFHSPTAKGQPVSLTYLYAIPSTATLRSIAACIEGAACIILMIPHILPNHPGANDAHQQASHIWRQFQKFLRDSRYLVEPEQDIQSDSPQKIRPKIKTGSSRKKK